jgi:hypothetical protein
VNNRTSEDSASRVAYLQGNGALPAKQPFILDVKGNIAGIKKSFVL